MSQEKPLKGSRKDRRDGYFVQNVDAMHAVMPHLIPNRTDCEAFINQRIDLTNILAYLEEKNAQNPEYRYTLFHIILAAVGKTLLHRPLMNRFISARRIFMRNNISLSFVAKKVFSDKGDEDLVFLHVQPDDTLDSIHNYIQMEITKTREGSVNDSLDFANTISKLPRWVLRLAISIIYWLEYHDWMPSDIIHNSPYHASVFISNLGSIKLNAGYHHLINWGTNSIFIMIGEKHKTPVIAEDGSIEVREVLNLGITLDERLADGYYYAKSVRLLKHLLENPRLLELPLKEEIIYE